MSAFRQAVLSVAPERLEQFSLEMKKSIRQKPKPKHKGSSDKSSRSKTRHKHSSHDSGAKRSTSATTYSEKNKAHKTKSSGGKTTSRPRSKDRKRSSGTSSKDRRSKKVKHKNVVDDSDFDPKDLDLSVPLPPLNDLVKDRKILLDTVFSIIEGPKLTSMLPDILKLMPLEEIKKLCGEQLDVMSSKRILHILSGTEMVSSSGTDSSDSDQAVNQEAPNEAPVPVSPTRDHSLQANFIDSTTVDQPTGPSMLFPSALSTAQATMASSDIPVKEITNDNSDQDTVSTSTEPNFIYTEGGQLECGDSDADQISIISSDTEEGEVQTSEEEFVENIEHGDNVEFQDTQMEDHPTEDVVLVEVEEVEEESDEDHIKQEEVIVEHHPPTKKRRKVSVKKVFRNEITHNEILQTETTAESHQPLPESSHGPNKHNNTTVEESSDKAEEAIDPHAGKSQLEILELELRARAIRSLMNAAQAGKLKP